MFANDPGGLAVAAAVRAGKKVDDIVLLSVGTGGLVARYPFEKRGLTPRRLGILPWGRRRRPGATEIPALPLVTAMFDGTSAADRLVCAGFLRTGTADAADLTELVEMDEAFAVPRLEAEARRIRGDDDFKAAVKWAKGLPND